MTTPTFDTSFMAPRPRPRAHRAPLQSDRTPQNAGNNSRTGPKPPGSPPFRCPTAPLAPPGDSHETPVSTGHRLSVHAVPSVTPEEPHPVDFATPRSM